MNIIEPGHAIFELLDVGIPLAWKCDRDLVAELCLDKDVEIITEADTGTGYIELTGDLPFRIGPDVTGVVVQGCGIIWTHPDEAEIVSDLKKRILGLVRDYPD